MDPVGIYDAYNGGARQLVANVAGVHFIGCFLQINDGPRVKLF